MPQTKKLSNNQKRFLRGIAHGLNPVILIGANGLTDNLMQELETTLSHHELLKIKMASAERADRKDIVDYILQQTGAELVQSIGKTVVISVKTKTRNYNSRNNLRSPPALTETVKATRPSLDLNPSGCPQNSPIRPTPAIDFR